MSSNIPAYIALFACCFNICVLCLQRTWMEHTHTTRMGQNWSEVWKRGRILVSYMLLKTWIEKQKEQQGTNCSCPFVFLSLYWGNPSPVVHCSSGKRSLEYPYVWMVQSTLVNSNSKGLSQILRDIRTSTYQICRIEETIIRLTTFNKYICNRIFEVRDILKILWKRGEFVP